jgi:hypothetical protein
MELNKKQVAALLKVGGDHRDEPTKGHIIIKDGNLMSTTLYTLAIIKLDTEISDRTINRNEFDLWLYKAKSKLFDSVGPTLDEEQLAEFEHDKLKDKDIKLCGQIMCMTTYQKEGKEEISINPEYLKTMQELIGGDVKIEFTAGRYHRVYVKPMQNRQELRGTFMFMPKYIGGKLRKPIERVDEK